MASPPAWKLEKKVLRMGWQLGWNVMKKIGQCSHLHSESWPVQLYLSQVSVLVVYPSTNLYPGSQVNDNIASREALASLIPAFSRNGAAMHWLSGKKDYIP